MPMALRTLAARSWRDPAVVATAHGAFNVLGGAWPIASIRSFEAVFGPKTDRWLEYTVSGLLVSNGVAQLRAARAGETRSARWVGNGTAVTLLAIDLVYVPAGRLRWTYLVDAAFEIGWLAWWRSASRPTNPPTPAAASYSPGA